MTRQTSLPAADALLTYLVAAWSGLLLVLWSVGFGDRFLGLEARGIEMSPVTTVNFLACALALRLGRSQRPTAHWLAAALAALVVILLGATAMGLKPPAAGTSQMSLSSAVLFGIILTCLSSRRGDRIFLLALFGMSTSLGMLATHGLDATWPLSAHWRLGMSAHSAVLFFVLFTGIALAPDRPAAVSSLPSPLGRRG